MKSFLNNKMLYVAILFILISLAGCSKKNQEILCGPCPLYLLRPGITVKIVDKTTGNDLFFGDGAPYQISQLKLYQVINGKTDTISANADTVARDFFIGFTTVNKIDTVNMQIANLAPDHLIINTALSGPCCPQMVISSVIFDGNLVYTKSDGYNPIVLKK